MNTTDTVDDEDLGVERLEIVVDCGAAELEGKNFVTVTVTAEGEICEEVAAGFTVEMTEVLEDAVILIVLTMIEVSWTMTVDCSPIVGDDRDAVPRPPVADVASVTVVNVVSTVVVVLCAAVGAAVAEDPIDVEEIPILLALVEVLPIGSTVFAVAPAADSICEVAEVAGNVELSRSGSKEVFPEPTPTAGTLPFSLPDPVGNPSMAENDDVDDTVGVLVLVGELIKTVLTETEELVEDEDIPAADTVPCCLCTPPLVVP